MITVCLGANTHQLASAGGHFWVYLNWALGLRALGCEVIWLEQTNVEITQEDQARIFDTLHRKLQAFGLGDCLVLCPDPSAEHNIGEETNFTWLDQVIDADLLLNVGGKISAEHVAYFRRSALIDIDPGLTQIWASESGTPIPVHDVYLTIGETVGVSGTDIPDCGVEWHFTPTAIYLPEWPITSADATAPYTTVSSWWGWWEVLSGQTFNNEKRQSFLEYIDLPSRASLPFELALALWGKDDHEDITLLRKNGWNVREAFDITNTPEQYRSYLGASRGEFSCAKPSCARLQNAWVSDRSLCYMAMGKPAIVEYTGPSSFLPEAEGLLRFRNINEALRALRSVESDYEHHSYCARKLVEEHFDAVQVVGRVLERVLI